MTHATGAGKFRQALDRSIVGFSYLGLSSFGGPAAHLWYFHAEYVKHRKWVTEELFSDLVALCQFLPGPASRSVQPRLDLCGPRTCGICAGACLLRTIAVLAACPLESCSFCNAAQVDLKLTEEEAAFIKKHPVIRLGIDPKFVPEGTSPQKINMIRAHNAKVSVVPGSRDNCADVCRSKVFNEGFYYANHVYNPFFYQGTKTYIYETYEQLGRIPQNILMPLGNGTLVIGIVKALEEFLDAGIIDRMPNLLAVQSERCDPFVKAVSRKAGQAALDSPPQPTMAEGIAVGIPMRSEEILRYIYQYDIKVITAPEHRILAARAELAAGGIYCEHTTAAGYAAYLDWCETNGRLHDCLIPMCGAGLKSDH